MTQELVTIAHFDDPTTAELFRASLQSEGIDAVLADQNTVGMAWHLSTALGGIRLQVMAEEEDQARTVLAAGGFPVTDGESVANGADVVPAEESENPAPDARESLANRAFKSGIIGLILSPLILYSLVLVVMALFREGPLSSGAKGKLALISLLDVSFLGWWIWFFNNL